MTSTLDGLDTRAKAAAILSGRKLQELERHGLVVVERSELDRYHKVEAAAKEIFANWQMGRPNYWELYKNPPEEFLKLHDALYPDASEGQEWALVDKRWMEALEQVAEYAKEIAYQPPGFFDPRWYSWTISHEDMELLIEAVTKLEALDHGNMEHRVTVKNSDGESWTLVFYPQPIKGYRAWATDGKSVWVRPEGDYTWHRVEATEHG